MVISADRQLIITGVMTANEEFMDAMIRHQVGILRVAGSIRNDILAILDATDADVRRQITEARRIGFESPASVQRLNKLLREIATIRGGAWGLVSSTWNNQMIELALREPVIVDGILKTTMPVDLDTTLPSQRRLRDIVRSQPFEGKTLRQWAKDVERADIARIDDQIKIGLTQGETLPAIARRVVGRVRLRGRDGVLEISRRQAAGITRTATNAVANFSRREYHIENADLFNGEIYVATLDSRTTLICASLDGKKFPVGEGPIPPVHFNAIAGGTLIRTADGDKPIENVAVGDLVLTHRSRYMPVTCVMAKHLERSEIIQLEIGSGRVLRISDDHPVLCAGRGWIHAGQLEVGDQVFEYGEEPSGLELESGIEMEADDHPPILGESFIPGQVSFTPGCMASTIDLKADHLIRPCEVDNARPDDELVFKADALAREYAYERGFSWWGFVSHSLSVRTRHLLSGNTVAAWVRSFHSVGVLLGEFLGRFWAFGSPMCSAGRRIDMFLACPDAIGLRSGSYAVLDAPFGNGAIAKSEFTLDRSERPVAIPVFNTDDRVKFIDGDHWSNSTVSKITILPFKLPVYNIAVEGDESYVASGVIVHNCRSLRVGVVGKDPIGRRPARSFTEKQLLREFSARQGIAPVTSRGDLPRGTKGDFDAFSRKRKRELTGTTPSKVSYQKFLQRQTVEFQDDYLGQTKGRLFRSGVPLDRFVDPAGRPIPLSQLARTDKAAFEAAGLDTEDFL